MISSSSIHPTIFNNKKTGFIEEGESVSEDIAIVEAEIIQELEELYNDNDEEY